MIDVLKVDKILKTSIPKKLSLYAHRETHAQKFAF